jgi:hypothetical protein
MLMQVTLVAPFESSLDHSRQAMVSVNIVLHGALRPSGKTV